MREKVSLQPQFTIADRLRRAQKSAKIEKGGAAKPFAGKQDRREEGQTQGKVWHV